MRPAVTARTTTAQARRQAVRTDCDRGARGRVRRCGRSPMSVAPLLDRPGGRSPQAVLRQTSDDCNRSAPVNTSDVRLPARPATPRTGVGPPRGHLQRPPRGGPQRLASSKGQRSATPAPPARAVGRVRRWRAAARFSGPRAMSLPNRPLPVPYIHPMIRSLARGHPALHITAAKGPGCGRGRPCGDPAAEICSWPAAASVSCGPEMPGGGEAVAASRWWLAPSRQGGVSTGGARPVSILSGSVRWPGWSWIGGLGAVPGLGDEAATRGGVGWAGFRRRVPARALGGGSVGMTRLFVGCAGHLTRRDAPGHRGWRLWRPSGPVIIAEVLWWPSGRL